MLDNDINTETETADNTAKDSTETSNDKSEAMPLDKIDSTDNANESYCVLARKYRPNDFDSLIGQDALVRTLSNALKAGRIAQAFMLTGVRGVGKTTTARIIAKALNCSDTDSDGNPPVKPCGSCENCNNIGTGSHIDVIEMDAASNTGIDDIREIIESTQYTPTMGRYKVYILDEVHMLSKNAFNGLLKTLEEPPAHVKFIFATTEIGKVPVTILSRCQRFDLRRVTANDLVEHYSKIIESENFTAEDEAVRSIARCADGSVRDGLSILDQAMALCEDKKITSDLVNSMLGLSDREAIYELFKLLLAGDNVNALNAIGKLYDTGGQPLVILQELLDISWLLTRFKVNPELLNDTNLPEIEKKHGGEMAEKLSIATLTATWQILNKGLSEMLVAENQIMTLEMIAVRLMYASNLPSPADIVKKLISSDDPAPVGGGDNDNTPIKNTQPPQEKPVADEAPQPAPITEKPAESKPVSNFELQNQTVAEITPPKNFEQLYNFLFKKSPKLAHKLFNEARFVGLNSGVFEINVKLESSEKNTLREKVTEDFGDVVKLEFVESGGGKTLKELSDENNKQQQERAEQTEFVKEVKQHFPNAEITKIDFVEEEEEINDEKLG